MKKDWKTKKDLLVLPELTYWLFNVKHLGKSLAKCVPHITLSCISEYYATIDSYEAELLGLKEKQISRIRLIKHHHANKIFVFGRTVIPQNTYMSYKNDFDSLGNNSIGENFLFKNAHIKRGNFYVKKYSSNTLKYKLKFKNFPKKSCWARASVFEIQRKYRILVEEYFICIPSFPLKALKL